MESSKGAPNYWPGFVDALSNMIMVMIFVVLVFTVALVYFSTRIVGANLGGAQKSVNVSRHMDQVQARGDTNQSDDAQVLKAKLAQLQHRYDALVASQASAAIVAGKARVQSILPGDANIAADGTPAPQADNGALPLSVSGDGGVVTVSFSGSNTQLDDPAMRQLGDKLVLNKAAHYEIVGEVTSQDGYTNAQRQAYFRCLAVRNFLIGKGIGGGNIVVRLVDKVGASGAGSVHIRVTGS